jgi:ribosomal protein L22
MYCFRTHRPEKILLKRAKERRTPVFLFRHHQHVLDHIQGELEATVGAEEAAKKYRQHVEEILQTAKHNSQELQLHNNLLQGVESFDKKKKKN